MKLVINGTTYDVMDFEVVLEFQREDSRAVIYFWDTKGNAHRIRFDSLYLHPDEKNIFQNK